MVVFTCCVINFLGGFAHSLKWRLLIKVFLCVDFILRIIKILVLCILCLLYGPG